MLLFCGSLPESFKSSDEDTRVNEPLGKEESVADHSQRTLPGTMIMRTLWLFTRFVHICGSAGDLHMRIWKEMDANKWPKSHPVGSGHLFLQFYEPLCSWHAQSPSLFLW